MQKKSHINVFFSLLFLCASANASYEDKDMTKAFIETHNEELKVIEEIYNEPVPKSFFWDVFIKPKNGKFVAIGTGEYACQKYYISLEKSWLGNYSLNFREQDIAENGKQFMFSYASECLKAAYYNFSKQKEIMTQKKQEGDIRLNEKFTLPSK